MSIASLGHIDAREERARGCALEPQEARRRAQRSRDRGDATWTTYWLAYAQEVESWD